MNRHVLQTAVIGLGRVAWNAHLPALLADPRYEPVAAADPLPERCAEGRALFGIPRTYPSLAALLEREQPDLVVIATPTVCHAADAILALRRGCHVFCDKPAAVNYADFRAMAAAAEAAGRKLVIFQPRRVNQDTADLRAILDSGKLGRVFHLHDFVGRYTCRSDWQAFRHNGGGMLLNYGAHHVDQFLHLFGRRVRLLGCSFDRVAAAGDAEDVVKLLLRFDNGVLVDLDINQAAALSPYTYAVYGSSGAALQCPDEPGRWRLRYFDPAEAPAPAVRSELAAPDRKYPKQQYPFREEFFTGPPVAAKPIELYYRNLYDHLTRNAAPLNPPGDAARLMELLDEARAMAEGVPC